jgi:hypothetical protein
MNTIRVGRTKVESWDVDTLVVGRIVCGGTDTAEMVEKTKVRV